MSIDKNTVSLCHHWISLAQNLLVLALGVIPNKIRKNTFRLFRLLSVKVQVLLLASYLSIECLNSAGRINLGRRVATEGSHFFVSLVGHDCLFVQLSSVNRRQTSRQGCTRRFELQNWPKDETHVHTHARMDPHIISLRFLRKPEKLSLIVQIVHSVKKKSEITC